MIVAIPSEPKARWVFRVCEPADRAGAVGRHRDAMLLLVVLPTTAFALLQGLVFWTFAARRRTRRSPGAGPLIDRAAGPEHGKLPFACTYFPGNSRIFALWPLYILAFFIYTVVFAAIDQALLPAGPASCACVLRGRHVRRAAPRLASCRRVADRAWPDCGSRKKIRRRSSRDSS